MNSQILIQYLQKILPMPTEKAELIASTFQYKNLPKGTFLIEEGKICNTSYFIAAGCARMYTYDMDGDDITTMIFSNAMFANDFHSFFKRIPALESLVTMSDCDTFYLSFDALQHNFHSIPEFREFGRMMLINGSFTLKQRMLSMIKQSGEQRYANLMETNPEIFQHIPLKNIATYLGVTDTSLSRIRRDFMKKDLTCLMAS
jgi:CRP-like cAMP-binding protein